MEPGGLDIRLTCATGRRGGAFLDFLGEDLFGMSPDAWLGSVSLEDFFNGCSASPALALNDFAYPVPGALMALPPGKKRGRAIGTPGRAEVRHRRVPLRGIGPPRF